MARPKKIGTFGKIVVRGVNSGEILNLHFATSKAYGDALFELMKLERDGQIEIVDNFDSYSIYGDADQAMYSVKTYFNL